MSDLYFECNSGISGDMAVAALLDVGADKNVLLQALNTIPVKGFRVEINRVKKNGIDACDFNVILDEDNHDHDMNYLFGHENELNYEICHIHNQHNEHDTDHQHHHKHHEHRNLTDVISIIDKTELTTCASNLAKKIFTIIAEAESKAHGIPVEAVHFHEVGAIDSIVDVIALAVCFDNISPDRVYVPFLCEGYGTIRCQHGILPIPVPAVSAIISKYSIPIKLFQEHGEFVTPTGAAFVAAVATDFTLPQNFIIKQTGIGAGKREYKTTNILRILKIEDSKCLTVSNQLGIEEEIYKLETNIDNCAGDILGFVMEELLSAGALDVQYIPCIMKKSRPAYMLSVLCKEQDIPCLEDIIFTHTTTIGIRRIPMKRTVLKRESKCISCEYGKVDVKIIDYKNQKKVYPEYESIAKVARETGKSFSDIYREFVNLFENKDK